MPQSFSLEVNRPHRAIIRGTPNRAVFQYPDCKALLYQDQKIPFRELKTLNSGRKSFPWPLQGEYLKK